MVTENALIERMNDAIHELNEKARRSTNGKVAKSYLAEAASITKMMKGIIHNTAQMEDRKITCSMELAEITNYIRFNNLVTDEKLDELRQIAREKAKVRSAENQREIYAKNWIWILESVNSHNKYTVTRKWNARENMVDRVMRKYKEGKYEQFTRAI